MPAITVPDLSEAAHRTLSARAAEHGRTAEEEIKAISRIYKRPPAEADMWLHFRLYRLRA
jgi:plasmid stability protein